MIPVDGWAGQTENAMCENAEAGFKAFQLAWMCESWRATHLKELVPRIDNETAIALHSWLVSQPVDRRKLHVASLEHQARFLEKAGKSDRVTIAFVNGTPRFVGSAPPPRAAARAQTPSYSSWLRC